MDNYKELMEESKSVLIPIATSIITTIATTFIIDYKKRFGKIKIFTKNWECTTSAENEVGETTYVKANSLNVKDIYIIYKLEIYNGSEINKIMRDIKIEFFKKSFLKNRNILTTIPLDEDTKTKKSVFHELSEANVINIKPKECIEKIFHFTFNSNSDVKKLKNTNRIYISYINERNKKEMQFIKENIID
ncbi:conserved hypothetical protein [Clostridiaceae bacterium BL-3]|nr:conserved hypothetical protein [Clostridiaceae bacterium BL-3]